MTASTSDLLDSHFSALTRNEELDAELRQQTTPTIKAQGGILYREGEMCSHLPLLLEGCARVYKAGPTGRELTLYRAREGESCILTLSCILSDRPFPAFVEAETELRVRLVPSAIVREWMDRYSEWRKYVFGLLARRFGTVIAGIEEVAFRELDARLARTLLMKTKREESRTLTITQAQLASDLGSVREVVSRLLNQFEREGLVELKRGTITILDAVGLEKIVFSEGGH